MKIIKLKGMKNFHKFIQLEPEAVPIEETFLSELCETIEKLDVEEKSKRPTKTTISPSSMGCVRQMTMQLMGIAPDSSKRTSCNIGITESGTDRHVRLQAAIEQMNRLGYDCVYVDVETYLKAMKIKGVQVVEKVGAETKLFHKEFNMRFMCDGIIKYRGEYFILEIKTEMSFPWRKRSYINPEHYVQAISYAIALGIDKVLFLYENRDVCEKKCYILEITEDMKSAVIGKILDAQRSVNSHNLLPPVPSDKTEKTCRYCDYKIKCKNYNITGDING